MKKFTINTIPAILWGENSETVILYVHGKGSQKESAKIVADLAIKNSIQVLSFDLPQHGERKDKDYLCNVWNGKRDLEIIMDYVQENWQHISLVANSLGAYFSLITYQDVMFDKVLFISPIVNMEQLIKDMMIWFNVDEETLKEEKIIELPEKSFDPLEWEYYSYVKENPIKVWKSNTSIFYGEHDSLQAIETINGFINTFNCDLTILKNGTHALMGQEEKNALSEWLERQINNIKVS